MPGHPHVRRRVGAMWRKHDGAESVVRATATALLAEAAQGAYGDALDVRGGDAARADADAGVVLCAAAARAAGSLHDYCGA